VVLRHCSPSRLAVVGAVARIKIVQKFIVAETTALAGSDHGVAAQHRAGEEHGPRAQEVARLQRGPPVASSASSCGKVRYLRSLSFVQGTAVNALRTSIPLLMLYLIFARQITVGQFFASGSTPSSSSGPSRSWAA